MDNNKGLKVIDMFETSSSKINSSSSCADIGFITSHKIVFTPKELGIDTDNVAVMLIKSIKFSPADYNKKSLKNLLCGELLFLVKRYLSNQEKFTIDYIIKDFNNKFKNIVTLVSVESLDAFSQNRLEYEQYENVVNKKKCHKLNIDQSSNFRL